MENIDWNTATVEQCLAQLEFCGFECEAGPLAMNLAFQRLQWLAMPTWRVSTFSSWEAHATAYAGDSSRDRPKIEGNVILGTFRGKKEDVLAFVAGRLQYQVEIIPTSFDPVDVTTEVAKSETERLAKIADLKAQLAALEKK